jgi:hypothetical protein
MLRLLRRKVPPLKRLLPVLEGVTVLIAATNLLFVAFDLTYLPLREVWRLGKIPLYVTEISLGPVFLPVVRGYDPYKGIEPNPDIQTYLTLLDRLDQQIRDTGFQSPETAQLVDNLRILSLQMLDENPFLLSGQAGTLEKIQNLMRGHSGQDSSKNAFQKFWTVAYLRQEGSTLQERPLQWFKVTVRPLLERSNYIRKIGFNGEFIDDFWRIDVWFSAYFLTEFIIRVFYLRRRYPSLNLWEAALWRWYDLFLILPIFRWLRVIPVVIRMQELGVMSFEPIRAQISRGFVAAIAGEIIEVIALQVINQIQGSIRRGEITAWLLQSSRQEYIDLNNINELKEISQQLARVAVFEVLPTIQPDLSNLLQCSVDRAVQQLPVYRLMNSLPGLQNLPEQVSQQVSRTISQLFTDLSQTTYNTLTIDDPRLQELIDRLADNIRMAFTQSLLEQSTQVELQSLLSALLEEVKVNYVRRLREEDFDHLLEEAKQLN